MMIYTDWHLYHYFSCLQYLYQKDVTHTTAFGYYLSDTSSHGESYGTPVQISTLGLSIVQNVKKVIA